MVKLIAENGDVLFHVEGKEDAGREGAEVFKFPESGYAASLLEERPTRWGDITRAMEPFWRAQQPPEAHTPARTAERLANLQREMDGVLGQAANQATAAQRYGAATGPVNPIDVPGQRRYTVTGAWLHMAETRGLNVSNPDRAPHGALMAIERPTRWAYTADAVLPLPHYNRVRIFRTTGNERYVVTHAAPDRDTYALTYWPEREVCPGFEEPEFVPRREDVRTRLRRLRRAAATLGAERQMRRDEHTRLEAERRAMPPHPEETNNDDIPW